MTTETEADPGAAQPGGADAESGTPRALVASVAKAALVAPLALLGRVGLVQSGQWSDIRKQVVSSVIAATLVGGPAAIYSSWDKLIPGSLPPAFSGAKTGILVAKFEGDASGAQQTHVLRTLQRMFTVRGEPQAELHAYPRSPAPNRSREVFAGEREAAERGRAWLKEQNADFLIWGETAGPDVLRLRIMSRAAQASAAPMTSYRLDAESFLLPATFSEDFGRLLAAFAKTLAGPNIENNGDPRLLEVMRPVETRLRALFDNPPQAIKPADHAEIGIALASVSHAIALRTGGTRFDDTVRLYERLEPLVAASRDPAIIGQYSYNFGAFLFNESNVRQNMPLLRRALAQMDNALKQWTREGNPTGWMRAKIYFCGGSQVLAVSEKDAAAFDRLFDECVPFYRDPETLRAMAPGANPALAASQVETTICMLGMRRALHFDSADLFGKALADCRASEQRIAQHLQGARPTFYLISLANEVFALYPLHRDDALILRTAAEVVELRKTVAPDVSKELADYAADVSCIARMMEATVKAVMLPVDTVKAACDASLRRPVLRAYTPARVVDHNALLTAVTDNLAMDWPKVRDLKRLDLTRDYVAAVRTAYADKIVPEVVKAGDCTQSLIRARASDEKSAAATVDDCIATIERAGAGAMPTAVPVFASYVHYFRAWRASLAGDRDGLAKAKEQFDAMIAAAKLPSVRQRYLSGLAADTGAMLAELDGKRS